MSGFLRLAAQGSILRLSQGLVALILGVCAFPLGALDAEHLDNDFA
jgi:hypothetical protein